MKKLFFVLLSVTCFLSANSLEQIRSQNVIRIGVSPSTPPLSQLDRHGNFSGFEIDLAQELGKAIVPGGKIELIGVKAADRSSAVVNNQVDLLINNWARTERRAEVMDFSIPYLSLSLAIVAKKNSGITSEADLNNRKVAVIPDTNSEIYLKGKGIQTVSCHNNKECFHIVTDGLADAYMHNILNVSIIPLLDADYEVAVKAVGAILFDCVATQKGNKSLIEIIDNKILELSKQGFFDKAYQHTFANFYKGTVEEDYFLLEEVYSTFGM